MTSKYFANCVNWFKGNLNTGKVNQTEMVESFSRPSHEKIMLLFNFVLEELVVVEMPGKYRELLRELVLRMEKGSGNKTNEIELTDEDLDERIRLFEKNNKITIHELDILRCRTKVLMKELFETIREDRL